jgi:hypothetical protein
MIFLTFMHRKSRSPYETTVDLAASRGLMTSFRASVGGLPRARPDDTRRSLNASEDYPTPGLRLSPCMLETCAVVRSITSC